MSKKFDLDSYVPSIYGQEDYTFRQGIERGLLVVKMENNLETGFKNRYFAEKGFFKFSINGNQAKKYLKKGESDGMSRK